MKKCVFKNILSLTLIATLATIISCNEKDTTYVPSFAPPSGVNLNQSIYYSIDLNDLSEDKFKVKVYLSGLTENNEIYQFAAVVPGTYSISDFGRYVTRFHAFDKNGGSISSTQLNTNQWKIDRPEDLYYIEYDVLETWDTEMENPGIYLMGGTSIEVDNVLLNSFGVVGYPTGLKDRTHYLHLTFPDGWKVGTALERAQDNFFLADNYDELVDSPVLLGNLTTASTNVGSTKIDLFTYSANGLVAASDILPELDGVMKDAAAFLKVLPVDRYSFLFHFEDKSVGALEHSYSSVYVLKDASLSPSYIQLIRSIAAHEFFHVVTPLNIRSEIIEDFNFAMPVASKHLWLYEGVTEWASDLMQYRNKSIAIEELLKEIRSKYVTSTYYDETISLTTMSLGSYGEHGNQFRNVYLKGALVALLLDIKLLELSEGKSGLRELILQLMDKYGSDRAFDDNQFFDELVAITYPEIQGFINDYIKGTAPLPLAEYLLKIGIHFDETENTFELADNPTSEQRWLYDQWSMNL